MDLEKSESGSSSMSSSTSSITVFLPVLPFDDEGILPVTEPLTCSVLIWGNVSNENLLLPVDDPNLNLLPLQSEEIAAGADW